jgi:hypothetical protein
MLNMEIVWALVGLVGLVLLDAVLGVSIALKRGDFAWSEVARTLKVNILPYIISLAALGAVASFARAGPADVMAGFFYAFATAYTIKLMADLTGKVKQLFGIDVPT